MMLNRRTIIILAAIIGIGIIILAVIGFTRATQKDTSYTDPASGEKIIDDKTQQGTDQSLKNSIVYPGFSTLLDRGLTPVQIQEVQSAIAEYSSKQKDRFKEVSLVVDSMRHILPQGASNTHTLTFDLNVNRTADYYMTVEYENLDTVVTRLYSSDKKTLLIER
jgi:hypothetical protein